MKVPKLAKWSRFELRKPIDLRPSAGPLIPAGTQGVVIIKRRSGHLWVKFDEKLVNGALQDFSYRHIDNEITLIRHLGKQAAKARSRVEILQEWCELNNVSDDKLVERVNQAAANLAAEANNGGTVRQLEYLLHTLHDIADVTDFLSKP